MVRHGITVRLAAVAEGRPEFVAGIVGVTEDETEKFISLLTSAQDVLYRYVLTLMAGQHDRARDVLQEANLVIWRKADTYQFGTNFEAWARRIAHFCVLSDIRDRSRRPLLFGEELMDLLADEYDAHAGGVPDRQQRLEECMNRLPDAQRTTLRLRYFDGLSVSAIAERQHRSVDAVSALLYRIRLALMDCVRRTTVVRGEVST